MALVLSRRVGESIWVGDCEVTVVDVRGNQVRLAFTAPPEIQVLREEIKRKKEDERHDSDLG